jgi:Fe-S-cluster containining protein
MIGSFPVHILFRSFIADFNVLEKEISPAMKGDRQRVTTCRPGCGACCIAPSIMSPLPGMPQGKPAGVRCHQLTPDNRCRIHGRPERPAFCKGFPASEEHCGTDREEALHRLDELERLTAHVRGGGDRS